MQERLVWELNATGLAICHFDDLFQNRELWRSLSAYVSEFASSDEVQSVIRKRQQDFAEKKDVSTVEHYIITKYSQDRKPVIMADNPLLNLALHPLVLDVVNSYLGLWSKLIYFDMWHTLPLNTDTRFLLQRWHRDPEDRRKVRTFFYFSEVDRIWCNGISLGQSVRRTLRKRVPVGRSARHTIPSRGRGGAAIPASQRLILQGPAGTLIFCDTAGFHRGGIAKTKPRILSTSAFVTQPPSITDGMRPM